MSGTTIRWGILGLGRIARKFAEDLRLVEGARLEAVASTDLERARAFAVEFGAHHAVGRYEDLLKVPGLDVVYVATPHSLHAEATLMCLEAGIAVVCEKPLAMNRREVFKMVETARRRRVFLMEALWTRFIPGVRHALQLAEYGAIGRVHTVRSDFGFHMSFDPGSRLFNKTLGGGALLDIGIYPAMLALMVFGKPRPENILAGATFAPSDVDESCAFIFQYDNNQMALGQATFAANTRVEAWISGSEGQVYLHPRFHHTQRVTLSRYDGRSTVETEMEFPYEGWGYAFEAAHVMTCLQEGLLESPELPLGFSLDLAETLDTIRSRISLEY